MTGCWRSGPRCPGCGRWCWATLEGRALSRDRVLAAAIRLVDLGFFRPGGDEYAVENGSYGLATIRRDHVTCRRSELVFDYIGKSAQHREQAVADERVCAVVRSLKRRRDGGDGLLAYRSGPRWHDVTAADINDYLREVAGDDFTAKDFRTWHATVLAAVGLAVSDGRRDPRAPASGPSPAWSARWPATWATPRRSPGRPTSTRA